MIVLVTAQMLLPFKNFPKSENLIFDREKFISNAARWTAGAT